MDRCILASRIFSALVLGSRGAWQGFFWCVAASLDRLLPLVELNKDFAEFFKEPSAGLSGSVIAFFAFLRLWGWVLHLPDRRRYRLD